MWLQSRKSLFYLLLFLIVTKTQKYYVDQLAVNCSEYENICYVLLTLTIGLHAVFQRNQTEGDAFTHLYSDRPRRSRT